MEAQLKGEVDELMRLAEQAGNEPLPEQLDIPLELQHREQLLNVIAAAKQEMEARAQARFEAERQARAERTARKPGGKPPKAPEPGDDTRLKPHEQRELVHEIPAEGVALVRGELFYNLL